MKIEKVNMMRRNVANDDEKENKDEHKGICVAIHFYLYLNIIRVEYSSHQGISRLK